MVRIRLYSRLVATVLARILSTESCVQAFLAVKEASSRSSFTRFRYRKTYLNFYAIAAGNESKKKRILICF